MRFGVIYSTRVLVVPGTDVQDVVSITLLVSVHARRVVGLEEC